MIDSTVFWIVITIEVLGLAEFYRRMPAPSAAHLIIAYIIASQSAYYFASISGTWDMFMGAGARYSYYFSGTETILLYFKIACVAYISTLGIRRRSRGSDVDKIRRLVEGVSGYSSVVVIGVNLVLIANLLTFDWEVVWSNNRYLMMQGADGYTVSRNIAVMLKALMELSGIIGGLFLIIAIRQKSLMLVAAIAPATLFIFLFQLSAHSRYALVYCAVVAFASLIILERGRIFAVTAAGAMAVFSLIYALDGRNGKIHGLGTIGDNLAILFRGDGSFRIERLVVNLLQGIFVTGDALTINADYGPAYKILSFSPLPSAIDGFNAINLTDQVRVHFFVPFSAVAEVYWFGGIYVVIALVFFGLCLRRAASIFNTERVILAIFVNFVFAFIFVYGNAYPLRNVFRQALFALVLVYIFERIAEKRAASARSAPAGPQFTPLRRPRIQGGMR